MSRKSTALPVAVQPSEKLSVAHLRGEHRQLLVRAITRVLSTDVAEMTYAQIIDGLPIGDVAYDSHGAFYYHVPKDHPLLNDAHEELCPGMLDKAREFRDTFRPETLRFDAKLLHAYRACAPGSSRFETRLIEMVAVAVHQIAAILFELDTSVHKDDSITGWAPPESDTRYWSMFPNGPPPTLFYHNWYQDHDQYPKGVADMVGYWAEARIPGGVILFDRRDPEAEPQADPDAIYFHSDYEQITYRIYQLLPEQRKALADFLLADEPSSTKPLPILGDQNNLVRVDPEEPIQTTGIYRDLWERKDLSRAAGDDRMRCVWSRKDYPTMEDFGAARHRAYERKWRIIAGEDSD